MAFEIFSRRKRIVYGLKELFTLYMGFLTPILKCLRCRCFNLEKMLHNRRIFEKANLKI
jgi:hypothetical protein